MSVFYRKYQNKNSKSVAYGKWFARAVTIGKSINIDELAKHMSEHNTPYSKVAEKVAEMKRRIFRGKEVTKGCLSMEDM